MNIGYILKKLEEETKSGLIEWKETGQKIEFRGHKIKGLSSRFEGLAITTSADVREVKGFFGRIKTKIGCAIKIEIGEKKETFTSNSAVIQGVENRDIYWTVIKLSELKDIQLMFLLNSKFEKVSKNK